MKPQVHDTLAFCRYQFDRCAHTVSVSKSLQETLALRLTIMTLQRSKNVRVRKQLVKTHEALAQQSRILRHGATAKYLV